MEGGLNPEKMESMRAVGESINTGTMVAVPPASLPETIQSNLSLYDSSPVWAAVPRPEFRVSAHEQYFAHWPFNRAPGFLELPRLTLVDRIPTDFYSQMLCGFFLALVLRDGELGMGLRPLTSRLGWEESLQLRYPSGFSTTTCGFVSQPFSHLHLFYQCGCGFFSVSLARDFCSVSLQVVIHAYCFII